MTRRVALILAAVSVGALAGCDGVVGARMTFDDTETIKITEIVLTGGASDLVVETGEDTTTTVRRTVEGGGGPGASYKIDGGVLTLPSGCGPGCQVDYRITAPAGVTVRGQLTSGDIALTRVGPVDLRLTSGDVLVEQSTGPVKVRATSGDVHVVGGTEVSLEARTGDLDVMDAEGPVTVRATSGDIDLTLASASSVTASVTSGDISLMVPAGPYRLQIGAGSGDEAIQGLTNDPKATNVLDAHTRSGNLTVTAR